MSAMMGARLDLAPFLLSPSPSPPSSALRLRPSTPSSAAARTRSVAPRAAAAATAVSAKPAAAAPLSADRSVVRLGLPSKGRMAELTLSLLKSCQLSVRQLNPRQYTADIPQVPNLEVWFQRPTDIVRKLCSGDLDLGIVGYDIISEYAQGNDDLVIIHDALDFGHCRLSLAVPKEGIFDSIDTLEDLLNMPQWTEERPMRVVTGFGYVGAKFLKEKGFKHVSFLAGDGALESYPAMGMADAIVDLVSSGTTLRENNLKEIEGGVILEPASSQPPPRLYACLTCATVFCPSHAASHAASAPAPGHQIAVDVDRAELFCAACGDQVYDPDFDHAVVLAQSTALHPPSASASPPSASASPAAPRKRRRVDYRAWAPDPAEVALVRSADPTTSASAAEPAGLRGLNNLGNTCFMNSVLQALLHAPPLRNYFLGDRHNRFLCPRRTPMRHRTTDAEAKAACLACDLDEIYSATFSGERTPYSPAKFLYSWWQHATNLASYEQQDAHEFFISILDHIHENIKDDQPKSHEQGDGDCCIAHRVFSGILRSDVICTNCGFSSTTFEPCMDVSLDLDSGHNNCLGVANPKPHARNGMSSKVSTLMRCLERFTRAERLDAEQKYFCERCKERQVSLKQMSIRRLPLVSCFHIKRFEHSTVKKMSRKVDHSLQFPFSLDMTPYLSSSILRSRYGNRIFPSEACDSDAVSELPSEFEIFAVITHSGKLDAGHYVTYLRLNNQWYRCDDAWVTRVDEHTVRSSQAYMLFYVQKTLYYKACERAAAV